MITPERVRELLDYNPTTGIILRRVTSGPALAGCVAGCPDKNGYIVISVDGEEHKGHRLAWVYVHGEWPPHGIDHKNNVPSDNRIDNLRPATQGQNMQNQRKAHKHNKSGLLGVSSKRGRWFARIRVDGRVTHLGTYGTPEQAHQAYLSAKERLHSHRPTDA